ncbi:MAG: Xaa-Pro dipeptidase [Halieaceae bacterium]|jgi:Xaa-Pro dipeptidase
MTLGIGGGSIEEALAAPAAAIAHVAPITREEFASRIALAQQLMRDHDIACLFLNAGTNLYYFTGTSWHPSERLVACLLPADGEPIMVAPTFERGTLLACQQVPMDIACWEEHECPYALCADLLRERVGRGANIGLDESTPFFLSSGLQSAAAELSFVDATPVSAGCRMHKSSSEIALLQAAKNITLEVHKRIASVLSEGVSAAELSQRIDQIHRALGAAKGSSFCIVLFGEDTAFPHGVAAPKTLEHGDMVLIDTGCLIEGYNSDITRSYVFGDPSAEQRRIWDIEKAAQAAAFAAAVPGAPCEAVDLAARQVLESAGLGPDYALPGLPHRTGHGIGLDIHEWPYLVKGNRTALATGMCFSNEPMICVPGKFGVRHEDHFYMSEQGPRWFTEPARSIDAPFG